MKTDLKEIGLREIINFDELEKLFKSYSLTSGFDVVLYGLDGTEQLVMRRAESICAAMHGSFVCRDKIVQCGKKAEELNSSYIYETPCGLIMCIAAVCLDGQAVGYITTGPVVLWEKDEYFYDEMRGKCAEQGIDCNEKLLENVRQVDCESMTGISEMLRVLVEYMAGQEKKFLEQRLEISRLNLERIRVQRELQIKESQPCYNKYPIELEKELIAYVQFGDKNSAKRIINRFLNEIFSYASGDLEIIKAKLYEFCAFLSRSAVEAGAPLSALTDIVKKSARFLLDNIDFQDLCSSTIEIMENFIDVVYESRSKRISNVHLAKAIRYINAHYADDLDLETLAKNVFVSSYYISHLFRNEMGTTFSDYLTKIRLDNAKKYLMEGLSVEKTAELVGYNDGNYFIKIFKKYVGVTPAKYRRSIVQ